MKTMRIALAATAVSVMVVAAFASVEQGPLPAPSPATRTIKPGTQLPVFVPGTLVASPTRLSIVADSGIRTAVTLAASYTGTGGVLDVQTDTAHLSDPVVTPLGGGRFSITLQTSDLLAEGSYRGTLRLRMCADAGCTNPITGATAAVQYTQRMRWGNPGEWETYQGNARHDGYVPIVVDVSKIQKRWEWQTPTAYYLNPVTTAPGLVFVTERSIVSAETGLHALDALDGHLVWRQPVEGFPRLNPPAVADGVVYVATAMHEDSFLHAFRASDGTRVFRSNYDAQWNEALAPTIADGKVFINGGAFGGAIHAFDTEGGGAAWSQIHGDDEGTTPAVGDGHVYHGTRLLGLKVYESATGNTVAAISDPLSPSNTGYLVYDAAPMLGSPDHVFARSGNEPWRRLVAYAPSANAVRWSSARSYCGVPAFKDGVVYAMSCSQGTFDVLDEDTGEVLWSWTPPESEVSFNNNVVVTRNVAFVSTAEALYAIDLATRQDVWSIPTPGNLAIAGDGTLYVLPGVEGSTRLIAYRLR